MERILKHWIYANKLKKALSNLINNFLPNECEKNSLVEMLNITISVNWAFIDNMRERICSVNKKSDEEKKKITYNKPWPAETENFTFHFIPFLWAHFVFNGALSYLCHKCARFRSASIKYIYICCRTWHQIPFVCYWPFNRFVERNSKLSNEHIYDTNLHLCFVSSPIRIVANMKCGFWNKFYFNKIPKWERRRIRQRQNHEICTHFDFL